MTELTAFRSEIYAIMSPETGLMISSPALTKFREEIV